MVEEPAASGAQFMEMESCYSAYGLRITSPIALPELISAPVPSGTGADLVITLQLPRLVQPNAEADSEHYFIHRARAQLFWPAVGQFEVENGRVISIVPTPNVEVSSLRPYLLGPALAIALYQRGFTVLHCSAVALPDTHGTLGVVAFLGHSGEGKSTLAAAFHHAGHRVFADDYLAIPPLSDKTSLPLVFPGFPALRLGQRSLRVLGEDTASLPPLYPPQGGTRSTRDEVRYVQSVTRGFATESLPLRCLYILQRNPPAATSVQSEPLLSGRAMPFLLRNLYCAGLVGSEETAEQFLRCGEVAARVPVRLLRRPRDLTRLSETVEQVLRDNV